MINKKLSGKSKKWTAASIAIIGLIASLVTILSYFKLNPDTADPGELIEKTNDLDSSSPQEIFNINAQTHGTGSHIQIINGDNTSIHHSDSFNINLNNALAK